MDRNEIFTEYPIGMDPYLYGNKYGSVSIGHAVTLEENMISSRWFCKCFSSVVHNFCWKL